MVVYIIPMMWYLDSAWYQSEESDVFVLCVLSLLLSN